MVKYLFILFSFAFSAVTVGTNGNYHFTTIQEAIDSVTFNPIDTEINVYPGTYQENLLIESDMVILSMGDATNTIIDGSLGRGLGSTVVIRPGSGSAHKPDVEIDGFEITGGKGTDIKNKTITLPDGTHPIEKVGGGIFVYVNSPKINNCKIIENGNLDVDKGGGVFAVSDKEDSDFSTRDDYVDSNELTPADSVLDLSNNIFLDNEAFLVNSIYVFSDDYVSADLSSGYYDVYVESENLTGSSEYWIKSSGTELDQSNGEGENTAILDTVYVSPNGSDIDNDGLSWESPFQTINHAISQVYADSLNPATVYLSSGTFSPSTSGESFPINMVSYVNLLGQGEEVSILDAEQTNRVVLIDNSQNNRIQKLTIMGGFLGWNGSYRSGGGIAVKNSSLLIENVTIKRNEATSVGGGIDIRRSNIILNHVTISENFGSGGGGVNISGQGGYQYYFEFNFVDIIGNVSGQGGGGMYLNNYSTGENYVGGILNNVTISENEAGLFGGGIYIEVYSHPILNNVIISDNIAPGAAGMMIMLFSNPIFNNVLISNNIDTADIWRSSINITEYCNPIFVNVTISENNGNIWLTRDSYPTFINTIIFNNDMSNSESIQIPDPLNDWEDENLSMPTIIYSNIEGGWQGEPDILEEVDPGNIDADPLFVDPENGDYTLQEGSPCIDAGTADTDGYGIDDITDYFGDAPDMGAFEFEGQTVATGDLNGDGDLNIMDVIALVNIVLGNADPIDAGDLNADGNVNIMDVVALVNIILEV